MTVAAVERDIDVAEQNKDTIRRYVETWNRGDLEGVFQFWSPNIVHHTRTSSHGYEVTKQIVAGFTLTFPGMRFEIDDAIGNQLCQLSPMRLAWELRAQGFRCAGHRYADDLFEAAAGGSVHFGWMRTKQDQRK